MAPGRHDSQPSRAPRSSAQEDTMKVRHRFVAGAAVVALVAVVAWLVPAPAPAQSRTFVWKVQSSFPVTDYPHRSLIELAKSIEQMSGGRLKIETLPVEIGRASCRERV